MIGNSLTHIVSSGGPLPGSDDLFLNNRQTNVQRVTVMNNSSLAVLLYPGSQSPGGANQVTINPGSRITIPCSALGGGVPDVAVAYSGVNTQNGEIYLTWDDQAFQAISDGAPVTTTPSSVTVFGTGNQPYTAAQLGIDAIRGFSIAPVNDALVTTNTPPILTGLQFCPNNCRLQSSVETSQQIEVNTVGDFSLTVFSTPVEYSLETLLIDTTVPTIPANNGVTGNRFAAHLINTGTVLGTLLTVPANTTYFLTNCTLWLQSATVGDLISNAPTVLISGNLMTAYIAAGGNAGQIQHFAFDPPLQLNAGEILKFQSQVGSPGTPSDVSAVGYSLP